MWKIEFTDEFGEWWNLLNQDQEQESHLVTLEKEGLI